ncbi:MAG: ABC transporter ATP-binding protein [Betaproteobacteria bacterium]|nr:MAG: ABC transporter ATP-binding protein [Betaproteobacteria bacterium]
MADARSIGRIAVKGVGKLYQRPKQPPVQVLDNCSFEIEPAKLTVLMGASGCGKSTLAYMIAGYLSPDKGSMTIDDISIVGPGPDRIMVFQETALWPWMTVIENVIFGPRALGSMSDAEARSKANALLTKFGLIEFRDKYPGQLSGGMKRRAELAQALINSPKIMILDEPFRGLDVMTRELMQEYYVGLFEETRLTTLFITAELEEAIFLADRLLIMGGSPSRIVKAIEVDLPHPRTWEVLTSERYLEIKEEIMRLLYQDQEAELLAQ